MGDHIHTLTLAATSSAPLAAFLFGLLGSAHCFGMCGPLVSLAVRSEPSTRILHRQLLLYNLGRAIVYTDLGFLFGGIGRLSSFYLPMSGLVGLLASGFVMVMGMHFLCAGSVATWIDRVLARPTRGLVSVWHRLASLTRSPGIIVLGGLHGLLPCPLLYVMFSSALALQNPLQAGLLLFSFSLGTVPMMWGIGVTAHHLTAGKRIVMQRVFGGLVLLWGTVLLAHGLGRLQ